MFSHIRYPQNRMLAPTRDCPKWLGYKSIRLQVQAPINKVEPPNTSPTARLPMYWMILLLFDLGHRSICSRLGLVWVSGQSVVDLRTVWGLSGMRFRTGLGSVRPWLGVGFGLSPRIYPRRCMAMLARSGPRFWDPANMVFQEYVRQKSMPTPPC